MTTAAWLERWREAGAITDAQYAAISPLLRKERFSVFVELNALLYAGVLSIVAGVGWVIHEYAATLGDAAILAALTLVLGTCFYYCLSRTSPYSSGEVESPTLAFDYVLYLGCLVFGVQLGYVETRFHLLQNNWDAYLLISAVLFFGLAYRFDNRFVLSLALSTLAAWFGITTSRWAFFSASADSLRRNALIYGALAAGSGAWLHRLNIKRHFTETYFHVATNIIFVALVSGVAERDHSWLYLLVVLVSAAASVTEGIRRRKFAFVVYGTVYAYVAMSIQLLRDLFRDVGGDSAILAYFVISGAAVIVFMVLLARRYGREQ